MKSSSARFNRNRKSLSDWQDQLESFLESFLIRRTAKHGSHSHFKPSLVQPTHDNANAAFWFTEPDQYWNWLPIQRFSVWMKFWLNLRPESSARIIHRETEFNCRRSRSRWAVKNDYYYPYFQLVKAATSQEWTFKATDVARLNNSNKFSFRLCIFISFRGRWRR